MYGEIYLKIYVLLLRDLRPLLTPNQPLVERWGKEDYNPAILQLESNVFLFTYVLRVEARLGHISNPRILGDSALEDGRRDELPMWAKAVFDSVWTGFDGARNSPCREPCLLSFLDLIRSKPASGRGKGIQTSLTRRFFSGAFAYLIQKLVWSRSLYIDSC
jgi:hypothetical protein